MHILKKKIQIAQMNNEKYSDLENRLMEITRKLGYTNKPMASIKNLMNHIELYLTKVLLKFT